MKYTALILLYRDKGSTPYAGHKEQLSLPDDMDQDAELTRRYGPANPRGIRTRTLPSGASAETKLLATT